ncbi:MAG TPA: SPFH domain-containing protein [Verrucomicrobiota bacterium]|nr:SPFH domain-containing protein [Verrucomicrobiota bacterium]HNU49348.1 SPFH domain-containing protein [Verrucomicrobiota bacterium]
MLGIRFIKVPPTTYLLEYRRGRVVREGAGLAFFYCEPTTSLVAVPVASVDVPFIFGGTTADFQEVTLQGQVTYRVADPRKLAGLMNFTLAPNGIDYAGEDPGKLPQRVMQVVEVLARAQLEQRPLKAALRAADVVVDAVRARLKSAPEIETLGLEILGLSLQSIQPSPETARALEAEARESLLQEADVAISARRNAAIEQERALRENELNTEIAVETKKRQIRETQLAAEMALQEKQHELRRADMTARIDLEGQKRALVDAASDNARIETDARAYALSAMMKALGTTDWRVVQALASAGMKPEQLIGLAFQELAAHADRIGQLNLTPDLLESLLQKPAPRGHEKAR